MEETRTTIKYGLRKITLEQFALTEEIFTTEQPFNINITISFLLDDTTRMVAVLPLFKIEKEKEILIKLEVGCHFEIEPETFKLFVDSNNNKIVRVPKDFALNLVSISIGTARGVLFAKTENSLFNAFMIPIIKASELIKEDVTFEIKTS